MPTPSKQAEWIAEVRSRPGSMTQRKEAVVASWPGGLDELVRVARSQDVHLLRIIDDRGTPLVAASIHPFDVLS